MTIPTGKEVHEWAQECLEICEAVESQLSSTIYRTETSRWWAVTNELSKLTHKLAVVRMKLFFDKSKGLPAGQALRFVSETMQSAMTADSHMYHREVLCYEDISQHCTARVIAKRPSRRLKRSWRSCRSAVLDAKTVV